MARYLLRTMGSVTVGVRSPMMTIRGALNSCAETGVARSRKAKRTVRMVSPFRAKLVSGQYTQKGEIRTMRYSVPMAHAYAVEGDRASGIAAVRAYAAEALGLGETHPDIIVLEYGLFSVDDAREVVRFASSSPIQGDKKLILIAATRIFHEAQNALLKLFEEPPARVTLVLCVPSLGQLLPTLRSRMLILPSGTAINGAKEFLALDTEGRGKYIAKLLERTKSDKDQEKQIARGELLELLEGITRAAYAAKEGEERTLLLQDLESFLPILHERSAPLKLIFEHLLIVLPESLRA